MDENVKWWIIGISAGIVILSIIVFLFSADTLTCDPVSVEYQGKEQEGIYCNVECSSCEDLLLCNKLEFTWLPGITGCEKNSADCSTCVIAGFDVLLCETFELDSNKDFRQVVEAQEGKDFVVTKTTASLDLGMIGSLGVTENGFDLNDIDWKLVLKDYLGNDYDFTIRYTVHYIAKEELSGVELVANVHYSDWYLSQLEPHEFASYQGNQPGSQNIYKSYNIAPGEHVIYVDIKIPLYAVNSMEFDDIDFVVTTYDD